MEKDLMRTIAQNAMQLVLRKEREPVDTLLLILPQLGLDCNGDLILLDLAAVKKLHEELPLLLPALEQVLGEVGRIRQARFERYHLHERSKRVRRRRADIVIRVAHASEDGDDHEDDVGKSFDVQLLHDV